MVDICPIEETMKTQICVNSTDQHLSARLQLCKVWSMQSQKGGPQSVGVADYVHEVYYDRFHLICSKQRKVCTTDSKPSLPNDKFCFFLPQECHCTDIQVYHPENGRKRG